MDEDKQQYLNRWLPENLSENVRVVISTIESTSSHQTLRIFKSSPTEIICGPLDRESRQVFILCCKILECSSFFCFVLILEFSLKFCSIHL